MGKNFDFSGWATKANLLCSDGRIIMKDAFKHCDGMKVPLVWNHQHNRPEEVLGHALLENRDDGVYAYCSFNDTESAQAAKLCVQHGDINAMSIYANKLKQQGANVIHGMIREVSLVLAGANPGAFIDSIITHGEDSYEEGYIYTGEYIENVDPLFHADNDKEEKGDQEMAEETKKQPETNDSEETVADVFNTLSEKQKTVVYAMIGQALEDAAGEKSEDSEKEAKHSDEDSSEEVQHADAEDADDDDEETVADVFNTLSEKQKTVVYAMIGQALEDADKENNAQHSDEDFEGGNDTMKHNVFDQETVQENELLHSEMALAMEDAKRGAGSSLKEAVLAHGIENLDIMFPDHKTINGEPEFIKRNDDWVTKVLSGVHHTPFARIKTIFADITKDQARAKGYTKGNLKIEEVFKLLKRTTNPTTVYKKQKLDRDDVLDIDWNVLPFLKKEIRMMLDEELARAFLIGDGRDPVEEANDKIDEDCIRPIWKMEDLFTVKVAVPVAAAATADAKAKAFIKACIKSRKEYKGSGNPTMFMSEDMLTDCLLIEDANQRIIYDTVEKLAAALRVKEIVPVPVMEGLTRTDAEEKVRTLAGIYVNLNDYNVGTDKGGEVNFFDDFDIDYNQMKYLMETRCSGTLTKPYSAVAIEFTAEA